MRTRDAAVVEKILGEVGMGLSLVEGVDLDMFLSDEKTKRAVCMMVINVGELVKNLGDDYRREHADVPWKAIAGFRDIAAHKYQTLRMDDVYYTVKNDFEALGRRLMELLEEEGEGLVDVES